MVLHSKERKLASVSLLGFKNGCARIFTCSEKSTSALKNEADGDFCQNWWKPPELSKSTRGSGVAAWSVKCAHRSGFGPVDVMFCAFWSVVWYTSQKKLSFIIVDINFLTNLLNLLTPWGYKAEGPQKPKKKWAKWSFTKTRFTLKETVPDSWRIRNVLVPDWLCRLYTSGRIRNKNYPVWSCLRRFWIRNLKWELWD